MQMSFVISLLRINMIFTHSSNTNSPIIGIGHRFLPSLSCNCCCSLPFHVPALLCGCSTMCSTVCCGNDDDCCRLRKRQGAAATAAGATTTNKQHRWQVWPAAWTKAAKPSICWSVIMPHHCQAAAAAAHPGSPACATFSSSLFYVAEDNPKGLYPPPFVPRFL